jgi:hypothetical protein
MKLYSSHLGKYMRRWIARTRFGTLRLHNILKSDEGRDFHDHPFSFVSLILKGGYIEHRPGCECRAGEFYEGQPVTSRACASYTAPALVCRRAEDMHRLELIGSAWTLVVSGPYRREWGFLLSDGSWQHYTDYHRSFYANQTK